MYEPVEDAPTKAWISLPDGEDIPLALEQTGPRVWTARPPAPVKMGPGMAMHVDRIPAQSEVVIQDVYRDDSDLDDWAEKDE